MRVEPIPQRWIEPVVGILETYDADSIEWTVKAVRDWHPFGFRHEAYALLIKTLNRPQVIGHHVVEMFDRRDGSYTDCWAFLCDHPWGSSHTPLYAKIGIHHTRVYINLFSLHPDDGSAKLQRAIEAYQKKHPVP